MAADEPGAEDRGGVAAADPIAGTEESMAYGSGGAAVGAPKAEGAGPVTAAPGAAADCVKSTVATAFEGGAGLAVWRVMGPAGAVAAGTAGDGAGGAGVGAGAVLGAAVAAVTGFEG
jgi:hypothetical protein